MSTNYSGTPDNIANNLPASVTILSSTNANPIVVQTSAAHNRTTGEKVRIYGHLVNTTANGLQTVTVVDSTHFSIPVAGVGVGGATGNVQPLALGPPGPNPSDGDDDAAASVNVQLQRLSDQTAYLEQLNLTRAKDFGSTVPGANWKAVSPVSTTGYTAFTAGNFDPINNVFLIGASVSSGAGACELFSSRATGEADYSVAVSSGGSIAVGGVMTGCCFDGTHYFASVITSAGSNLKVYQCVPGGAWSLNFTDAITYSDAHMEVFAGSVYVYGATNGSSPGMRVFACPVGGTAFGLPLGIGQVSGTGILTANNGTTVVSFPVLITPTNYMTSTTPSSAWTARSAAFLTHTNEIPLGLTYSAADGLFILVTQSGGTPAMNTYQSSDGITWFQVSALTSLNFFLYPPRSLGSTQSGCLVALCDGASTQTILYSIDAGVTWHQAMAQLVNPGFTALTVERVIQSPSQFWIFNSGTSRFSYAAGPGITLT